MEMRMVLDSEARAAVDPSLVKLVVRAHAIRDRLMQDATLTLKEIAAEQNVVASYITRLLRLAFLAPDITTAILAGTHPPELTARKLMDDTRLPLEWGEQRKALGFA
jgi:site-specific DNA recombinase